MLFPEIRRPERFIWIRPSLLDMEQFYQKYIKGCSLLAFDTETRKGQITCISFAPNPSMAIVIPFNHELNFEYGKLEQVSPLIRRVIAHNPSHFTFYGTGTYIIGHGKVAVVDPGPDLSEHVTAILDGLAVAGEEVTHILVTHTHMDHSPACKPLKEATGAPTYGYGPHGVGKFEQGVKVEAGGDMEFAPDIRIKHGDIIEGQDWSVECVFTPGHTSNHMCFQLREEKALFSGDHVMGWSTSVISPPDGDMESYMDSLDLLLQRDDEIFWPTHGTCIDAPKPFVAAFIAHRKEREAQILQSLGQGLHNIEAMVPAMYKDIDDRLYPAAARSVFAAMIYLVKKNKVRCEGELALAARYQLA